MFRAWQGMRAVVAVLAAATFVGRGDAQNPNVPNPNLKPTYGAVKLVAGFEPDPFVRDVQAGGNLRTNLGGVAAYVAAAPDFSVEYVAGAYPLIISAKSVGDTTLLVNLPDGTWVANDDSGGGLDPLLRFAKPQSGRYDIYVGTYNKDLVAAKLIISEIDAAKKQPPPPFNPNLPECFIVSAGIDDYRTANKLRGCLNDARNVAAAYQNQTGRVFRSVKQRVLLDSQASHGAILTSFRSLTTQGGPGDTAVLFLSGHGARTEGNKGNTWFFLPVDFNPKQFVNTALFDRQILDAADALVKQRKNVHIVIDACFSGQFAVAAQPYLARYQQPGQGGLAIFLSSAANQESTALGNFSAYAKAFADGMAGGGDLNKDQKITLAEMQVYSPKRTGDLLAMARSGNKQNAIVAWSPSLSRDLPLASSAGATVVASNTPPPPPTVRPQQRFVGTENLAGYGTLTLELYAGGRAIMIDAKMTTEGIWRVQGNQYTLSFSNGSVVYTGTLNGAVLSGTATSPSVRQQAIQSWNWTTQRQPG